ncbi:uncharacterized protein B0H64DRAFT_459310 [Chaetomium fimeti]|uniref:Uncharacterized protein n=1 Tax=Chaetomium fimeti TaxID=1854472 RepID=A0AAE0HEY8_9PEZI|nr:hypothetical protein B0H64DRAFT_459310 [Chaetomium fimeti]
MPGSVSRVNISLNTGDGQDQYYDEVCALSAQTINDNFEVLFKQRPDVKKLVFNDGVHGVLKATLLAPKVMIDPNQEKAKDPEIYLQVAFEEGSIWYSSKSEVSVSGWVITVSANLGHMVASAAHGDDDNTQFKKKRALGELKKTFALSEEHFVLDDPTKVEAGKYSIHRLFAALTENSWNDPIERFSTLPGPDGKPMLLSKWAESPDTLSKYIRVKETLKYWALEHQHSPFFTLGLQLRVHEAEGNDPTPTFVPFAARLQGYPYISQKAFDRYEQKGEQPTGEVDDPHNCLVICETVGKRTLPKTQLLSFTGNLGAPADSPGGRHLAGTFELCMGSMILPLRPYLYVEQPSGAGRCEAVYIVGAAPTDPAVVKTLKVAPPPIANDSFYALEPKGERCYQWSKRFDAPGSETETYAYKGSKRFPLYRHWKTYSEQDVKVTWNAGDHKFRVAGNTMFFHWEAYSSRKSFPWRNMDPAEGYWGVYTTVASWSIEVDLTVPAVADLRTDGPKAANGIVCPKIVGLNESTGLPKDFKVETRDMRYDIKMNFEKAEAKIKSALSDRMKHLIESIKGKFDTTGRFVYPGASTLSFGPPQLANNGDVYANIDFLPPKEGLVNVRGPVNFPYGDPLFKVPDPVTIPPNPTVDTETHPHLAWQAVVQSYRPGTGRLRVKLEMANPGRVATAFQMVKVQILRVRHEESVKRLFKEPDSEWEEKKKRDDKEGDKEDDKEGDKEGDKGGEHGESGGNGGGEDTATLTVNLKEDAKDSTPAPGADAGQAGKTTPDKTTTDPPPVEEFHPTWSISTKDIDQPLQLSVSREDSLDFTILPNVELRSGRRSRFIMDTESTFTLELEGTAPEAGAYVVQVHELWETTDLKDELDSSQWADSFSSVKLIRSGDGTGSGVAQRVTFAQAEEIQGVKKEK